jgi:putative DNA primase/helicase
LNRALQHLESGNHRLTCPACGRNPRDRTFGVTVEHDGSAVGHCFRCEYVETRQPDGVNRHHAGYAMNPSVASLQRESLSHYGIKLFDACVNLRGTVGEQYLTERGCAVPPSDSDLRFHPALKHPVSAYSGPALVGLVSHALTGQPISLHRTWIRADGRKADVEPPRMLLGGHQKKHGVIRLWPDDAVTTGLCITEGVETALCIAHDYMPVWSCIDAGNLAAMPMLAGIETLVIGADHDDLGIKAANICAERWSAADVDVRVVIPTAEKSDWADARCAA